jgi:hypothetical protein
MQTDWVPIDACTLPTAAQPLRVREFDDLFSTAAQGMRRVSPTRLTLVLDAAAEPVARDLVARESACCGFFSFTFQPARSDTIVLDVEVPANRTEVLDGLAHRSGL